MTPSMRAPGADAGLRLYQCCTELVCVCCARAGTIRSIRPASSATS
eukprot:CAMPEP_0119410714 /NCGR_PEP_ID=MMETSP1335-20130426/3661_1 /TAXON_ID=259385 /ORGANISM="Chrysoculter rhomboideus, Strain RCC1486" /LENGTH=45 /DNA_ID= /DNA_START= /DNA_END= /DNA_ORIENTATION=